ncbi:hypothetical protein F4802DRAFT_620880 [Xylaria palmicola]|nr:hypothetical protein F4802DRAFT_620880 [Xylaria palmicola]
MSTSTFSYAQAAKGQSAAPATTTSQQSPNQSQTPSVTGNPVRDANTTNTSTRAPSVAVSISSNDIDSSHSARSTSAKPDISRLNGAELNRDDTNAAASVAGSISSSKAGLDLPSTDGVAKTAVPRGRSTNTGSDNGEHNEGKKGKKPKKAKSAEKDDEGAQDPEKEVPPPKVELSEAPLPSFNVWVQRQQALAKTVDAPASSGANSAQTSTDSKARPANGETVDANKVPFNGKQGSKRDGEVSRSGTNQGSRRTAPRGARAHEKESEVNMLANNPVSWPTPETAAVNLKALSQTQGEKPEKEEREDIGAAKPKQKKEWVQLPNFVPTVKFETALPSRGPRGGRVGGSRGGRDAASSHHSANSNERAQDAHAGSRTNAGSKRAPVEGSTSREGRKSVPVVDAKLPKESASDNTNNEQAKANPPGVVNGTSLEQSEQSPNASQQAEESVKSSESHKDIRTLNGRDTHPQHQNGSNHRSGERTRGGGRGRGGFNQNNSNGMSHYAQNSYSSQHHGYQFPPNSRHNPPYGTGYPQMPYTFPGQPGPGQRKSTNGNRGRGSGRMPPMAAMNVPYDSNMYPAPTNPIYQYDSGNLLQLAQTQIEYYFSVENCVKDWYLRRHMDSQGFVPIGFIASFNRIREMLVDLNILKQACIDSTTLELVVGNDGIERVRSREGWQKWVIEDMDKRDASARHNGPSTWQPFNAAYQHPMMSPQYPVEAPPMFSPVGEHGFANGNYGMPPPNVHHMNGINSHSRPHESQLSAAVPEFSPSTATPSTGFKPASQVGRDEVRNPAKKEINGNASPHTQAGSVNGVMQGQPQASLDNMQPTNGVGPVHEIEGH